MTAAMNRLCIYGGSSSGVRPEYAAAAKEMGRACAVRGITVVYGGGNVGLMGSVADAALAAGGKVIGVIPHSMIAGERAHRGLTQLIAVDSMHERKQRMADLADAFVAMPGGIGTLEETAEILTWLQLGFHFKPVGLLNTADYYTPLLRFLQHMRDEQFLRLNHQEQLMVGTQAEELLDSLFAAQRVQDGDLNHCWPQEISGTAPGGEK